MQDAEGFPASLAERMDTNCKVCGGQQGEDGNDDDFTGIVNIAEDVTVEASEEECAQLCYNSKKCCNSFSTRPGKDGKKDLCLLNTIFENQVLL